jgi:hypothetical protein
VVTVIWVVANNSWTGTDWYEGLLTHSHKLCMESGLGLPSHFHTWDASETSPSSRSGTDAEVETMGIRSTQDKDMVCVMWPLVPQ